jgi:hypothetical protein
MLLMKPVRFLGNSREVLREFPRTARQEAVYQLERIQMGISAEDFKPMPSIGKGVEEIRIREEFRCIPGGIHGSAGGGGIRDSCVPEENTGYAAPRY